METDPDTGQEADPREQRRSEDQQIEEAANKAEEAARESDEDVDDPYDPDARGSVVVPGSDGTLSGTAFSDWVDDEGNLKEEHQGNREEVEQKLAEIDEAAAKDDESSSDGGASDEATSDEATSDEAQSDESRSEEARAQ